MPARHRPRYQLTRPVHAVTRITTPNTMRYQANIANEWRLTKRMKNLTASNALTNDTMQLMTIGPASSPAIAVRSFHNSYTVAEIRTGTATKKENSAAVLRDRPQSRPPMIVAPERLVPGMSDNAWNAPSLSASRLVS